MKYYDYVFVVLVYRNTDDLHKFIKDLKNTMNVSYRVIVVDSFYSEEVSQSIRLGSDSEGYDCISVENRGYGCGNNAGIEYTLKKYQFKYLIVCNSDVEIVSFDLESIPIPSVVAPMIQTKNGKSQNPFWARRNRLGEWFIYLGHKYKNKSFLNMGQAMNKVIRESFLYMFRQSKKNYSRIYAAHGSFLIFHKMIIEQMHPIFSPDMFLFYEEAYIANKIKQKGFPIFLSKNTNIIHHEDGSTKGSNINLSLYARESYIYYYENRR